MQLNELQNKVINRLRGSSDGAILITILEGLVAECRDMRNLKEVSVEHVKGHLLAADILDTELISRLKRTSTSDDIINDSFE